MPGPALREDFNKLEVGSSVELTRLWTYSAADEEADYVATALMPVLASRMFSVCSVLALLCASMLGSELYRSGGRWTVFASLILPVLLCASGSALSGRHYRGLRLRLRTLEACICATVLLLVGFINVGFSAALLRRFFDAPPSLNGRYSMLPAEQLMCAMFAFVSCGAFLPLQPPAFGALAVGVFALTVPLLVLAAPALLEHTTVELDVFALSLLTAYGGRSIVAQCHRDRYHYACEVHAALDKFEANDGLRQQLEAQDKRTHEELLVAQTAKTARSRLIRMVMHDIRSPLLSVANLAASLEAMDASTRLCDGAVREQLVGMRTCSMMMQDIVSDMLDFERIDSGRLELVVRPFELRQLAADSRATFEGLARERGVALVIQEAARGALGGSGGGGGGGGGARLLLGDRRRLQQCVNNGLSNAIKFTDAGGTVTMRIDLEPLAPAAADGAAEAAATAMAKAGAETADAAAEGEAASDADAGAAAGEADAVDAGAVLATGPATADVAAAHRTAAAGKAAAAAEGRAAAAAAAERARVTITIVDTGIGCDPSELALLNSPASLFQQVGRGQLQGQGGTGLGLHLARQLIDLHGGTLALSSAGRGRGTVFQFDVPLRLAPLGSAPPADGAAGGGAGDDDLDASYTARARRLIARCGEAATRAEAARLARPNTAATASGGDDDARADARAARVAADTLADAAADAASDAASPQSPAHAGSPPETRDDGAAPLQPRRDGGGGGVGAACRMLYAEDDAFLRMTVGHQLAGALVEAPALEMAVHGAEAVERVLQRGLDYFALVILDNQMPVMNGTEAARKLREAGYAGVIIGMTGDPRGCDDRDRFEDAGLDMCVDKTVQGMALLASTVKELARSYGARLETAGTAS